MTEEYHGTPQSGKSVVGSRDLNWPAPNTSRKGYSLNGPRQLAALQCRIHRPEGQIKENEMDETCSMKEINDILGEKYLRSKCSCEDNIKMDIKEPGCEYVDRIPPFRTGS